MRTTRATGSHVSPEEAEYVRREEKRTREAESYGLSESSIREYTVAPPVSLLEAHREPEGWEVERDAMERDERGNRYDENGVAA